MNKQAKEQIQKILNNYEDNHEAAGMAIVIEGDSCYVKIVGNIRKAGECFINGLTSYTIRCVAEKNWRTFLTAFADKVYSEILKEKEKADEANDQGQPGQ